MAHHSTPHPIPPLPSPRHDSREMTAVPTVHVAEPRASSRRDSNHYHHDRALLGVSTLDHNVPVQLLSRSATHNPTTSILPAPLPSRSWSTDDPPQLSHAASHLVGRPLTFSPVRQDPRLDTAPTGRSSLSSSTAIARPPGTTWRRAREEGIKSDKPNKGKKSGPPKAKLGGPGGKTFEKMLAAGQVKERRLSPSPASSSIQGEAPPPVLHGDSGDRPSSEDSAARATALVGMPTAPDDDHGWIDWAQGGPDGDRLDPVSVPAGSAMGEQSAPTESHDTTPTLAGLPNQPGASIGSSASLERASNRPFDARAATSSGGLSGTTRDVLERDLAGTPSKPTPDELPTGGTPTSSTTSVRSDQRETAQRRDDGDAMEDTTAAADFGRPKDDASSSRRMLSNAASHLGSNSFLRKSLGSILKTDRERTISRNSRLSGASKPVADVPEQADTTAHDDGAGRATGSKDDMTLPSRDDSAPFVDVPLSSQQETLANDEPALYDESSNDSTVKPSARTITPGTARKLGARQSTEVQNPLSSLEGLFAASSTTAVDVTETTTQAEASRPAATAASTSTDNGDGARPIQQFSRNLSTRIVSISSADSISPGKETAARVTRPEPELTFPTLTRGVNIAALRPGGEPLVMRPNVPAFIPANFFAPTGPPAIFYNMRADNRSVSAPSVPRTIARHVSDQSSRDWREARGSDGGPWSNKKAKLSPSAAPFVPGRQAQGSSRGPRSQHFDPSRPRVAWDAGQIAPPAVPWNYAAFVPSLDRPPYAAQGLDADDHSRFQHLDSVPPFGVRSQTGTVTWPQPATSGLMSSLGLPAPSASTGRASGPWYTQRPSEDASASSGSHGTSLFYNRPMSSIDSGSVDRHRVFREQASPRPSLLGVWDGRGENNETNNEAQGRPHHHERPTLPRRPGNSYRSGDTPALGSPQVALDEITIHPSQPLISPLSTSPERVKSSHNPMASEAFGFSAQMSHPKPDSKPDSPASQLRGLERPSRSPSPAHTPPPLQAAGHLTASPSPICSTTKQDDSIVETRRNTEGPGQHSSCRHETPRRAQTGPPSRPPGLPLPPAHGIRIPAVPEPPLIDNQDGKADDNLSFRSAEIKVDTAADDRRFREWTFPDGSPSRRPSISRRYTMPVETIGTDTTRTAGIASTLTERVDGLRRKLLGRPADDETRPDAESSVPDEVIAPVDQGVSTRSSIEFPLRQEKKVLAVVNASPALLGTGSMPSADSSDSGELAEKMAIVLHTLHRVESGLASAMEKSSMDDVARGFKALQEEIARTHAIFVNNQEGTRAALESSSNVTELRRLAQAFEQQESLLAGLEVFVQERFDNDERLARRFETVMGNVQSELRGELDNIRRKVEERPAQSPQVLESMQAIQAKLEDIANPHGSERLHVTPVEDLQSQLETLSGKHDQVRAENASLLASLSRTKEELGQSQDRLDQAKNRAEQSLAAVAKLESEASKLLSDRLAAESERDALAEAVRQGMSETERLTRDLDVAQNQLVDAEERRKAEQEQAVTLSSITAAAAAFQEDMLSRMARLDEGMHETMGSRVKEFEAVLDRKSAVEGEMDVLRHKLEETVAELAELKLDKQRERAEMDLKAADLRAQLEREAQARTRAEQRNEELEKQIAAAKQDREDSLLVADERASWVKMMEVRYQALAQENVYWRQFALESDRKKYRAYMESNPFQSTSTVASPPDTQLKTPARGLTGSRADAQASTATPSRRNAASEGRMMSASESAECLTDVGSGEVKRGESDEHGTWWTAA